jgi:aquaporin Z
MDRSFRPYLAELVGTFSFVFVSALAVCTDALAAIAWPARTGTPEGVIVQPQPGLVGVALASGFIYAAALAWTGPQAGGCLNPAITLMLWVFKRLDNARTAGFIAMQILGGALAGGAIRILFSFREDVMTSIRLATPHMNARAFGITQPVGMLLVGIGVELVLTLVLTMVLFAFVLDPRRAGKVGRGFSCLWVGLTQAAAVLAGFGLTGAALNPARWFGTVIWESSLPALQMQQPFSDQVIYWFGPIAGALLAGAVYTTFFLPEEAATPEPAVAAQAARSKK